MEKLIILGQGVPGTGVTRYEKDLYHVTKSFSSLYSMVYTPNKKIKRVGIELIGKLPTFRNYINLNYIFPGIAFRTIREKSEKIRRNGGIVHYSSQMIAPIDQNTESVVTVHDLIVTKKISDSPLYMKVSTRWNLRKFMKFSYPIANSHSVKRDMTNFGFENNIEVIYPPISDIFCRMGEKEKIRKKFGLPLDKKLVLSVSTTEKRKNLQMVKKVMERLGDDYKLVRIGIGLGNSIDYVNVSDDTINLIYNACDVMLSTSLEEGFGYPTIEAFKTGLPAVLSDIEPHREIAGKASIFVDPNDANGVRHGIIDMLDSPEEFIDAGIKKSEEFSMEKFGEKVRNFYSKILK